MHHVYLDYKHFFFYEKWRTKMVCGSIKWIRPRISSGTLRLNFLSLCAAITWAAFKSESASCKFRRISSQGWVNTFCTKSHPHVALKCSECTRSVFCERSLMILGTLSRDTNNIYRRADPDETLVRDAEIKWTSFQDWDDNVMLIRCSSKVLFTQKRIKERSLQCRLGRFQTRAWWNLLIKKCDVRSHDEERSRTSVWRSVTNEWLEPDALTSTNQISFHVIESATDNGKLQKLVHPEYWSFILLLFYTTYLCIQPISGGYPNYGATYTWDRVPIYRREHTHTSVWEHQPDDLWSVGENRSTWMGKMGIEPSTLPGGAMVLTNHYAPRGQGNSELR